MIKLLKFEWHKVWRQKSLYICFGISLIISLLELLLLRVLAANLGDVIGDDLNFLLSNYLLIMIPNSSFGTLLAIYLAIYSCHDHAQQTLKNIYARGYNRTAVYFAKYLVSLGITFIMALLSLVVGCVFGLMLNSSFGTISGALVGVLALQFWVLIGLHAVYFGTGMLIGKTGGSVALNLFGVSCVFAILSLILQIFKTDFNIELYDINMLMANLVDTNLSSATILRSIFVPLIYTVVFVWGSWYVNQRRDV